MKSGPPPRLPWSRGRSSAATPELQSPPLPQPRVQTFPQPGNHNLPPRSHRRFRRNQAPILAARCPGPVGEFGPPRGGKEAGRRVVSEGRARVQGGLWSGRGDSGELWVRGETNGIVGELAFVGGGRTGGDVEAGRMKGLELWKDLETLEEESPRKTSQEPADGRGQEEG